MLWWFVILAFTGGALVWAGVSVYLRVRRHMKETNTRAMGKEE